MTSGAWTGNETGGPGRRASGGPGGPLVVVAPVDLWLVGDEDGPPVRRRGLVSAARGAWTVTLGPDDRLARHDGAALLVRILGGTANGTVVVLADGVVRVVLAEAPTWPDGPALLDEDDDEFLPVRMIPPPLG